MFTVSECRAQAEQKLTQAEHDDRNRKRLIAAAEAWLLLPRQVRRAEMAARKRRANCARTIRDAAHKLLMVPHRQGKAGDREKSNGQGRTRRQNLYSQKRWL